MFTKRFSQKTTKMTVRKKNSDSPSLLGFLLLTFVIFVLGQAGLNFFSGISVFKSVLLGYLTSVVSIIAGYYSLQWAFNKNAKTFYIVLYGGMALRFLLFIAIMFVLYLFFPEWSLTAYVISFVVFYVLMQIFEINIINRELKRNKLV